MIGIAVIVAIAAVCCTGIVCITILGCKVTENAEKFSKKPDDTPGV